MIHEAPKKDKSLWGEQPAPTPLDDETKKSKVHPPKSQPHHKAPRERPRSTCTTHPRQPPPPTDLPPRSPRQTKALFITFGT